MRLMYAELMGANEAKERRKIALGDGEGDYSSRSNSFYYLQKKSQ